jgi:hypothetical protein
LCNSCASFCHLCFSLNWSRCGLKYALPNKAVQKAVRELRSHCSHCEKKNTGMWRRGPSGNVDLCNKCASFRLSFTSLNSILSSCGKRYARGTL